MRISEGLIGELDYEAGQTRRVLERVPADRFEWTPHPKSMTLGRLASHIAEIPHWTVPALKQDEFVMQPGEYKPWLAADSAELLQKFEETVRQSREALDACPDEKFGEPWQLKAGDELIFELPRIAVLRNMVFNHLYHHRGQLLVYLRLLDVPLPSVYGPSADEQR